MSYIVIYKSETYWGTCSFGIESVKNNYHVYEIRFILFYFILHSMKETTLQINCGLESFSAPIFSVF